MVKKKLGFTEDFTLNRKTQLCVEDKSKYTSSIHDQDLQH